ncbi:MAG TPA: kelch repeat-containing protein [Candidatus Limnocylindria bacterium]|nr:kelch repeat-containing protein [Candidatus Limnocylindria bacterium]
MTPLARVLTGLVVVALAVAVTVWLARYQPFGPGGPIGTPLPTNAPAARGWADAGEAPFARLEMATAVHDGQFWLAGGFAPDGSVSDALAVFDPTTGEWTDGPSLPEALHHAALASDGERLYLVGGYLGSTGQPTEMVRVLDSAAGEWTEGPSLPQPRAAGALAFDGSRFVYAGGVGPGGVRGEVFALDGEAWQRLGDLARPREHLAAATDGDGRVWFLGGRQGGLDRNVGDVELVTGDAIDLIASVTPRGGVAAFFTAFGACLTGGEAPTGALSIVECVDADGRVTALPPMTQPRHGHGAGVVDGVAYALLGGDQPGLDATATVETLPLGE